MPSHASKLRLGYLSIAIVGCSSTPPAVTSSTGGTSSDVNGETPAAAASAGAEAAPSATAGFESATCQQCTEASCPTETTACREAPGCSNLLGCLEACDPSDLACPTQCAGDSTDNLIAAQQYYSCLMLACLAECTSTEIAGLGGAGGTGTVASTGGAVQATAGAPTVPASGGAADLGTGGTAPTPATGGATTGTQWLHIEGDWADPEYSPNGELNISGVFYAYGDSCASLAWDPETRCVSGTLCAPGPTYENWGIAVGFDFHNTGEGGTPPNAKLTWDPGLVGARGIQWSISGTAPGLQVWITNMAPSWAGVCTADSCEILGPPDGTAAASSNGILYFASMSKDDWGGSGIYYSYDPAATLAIQFKLPAIIAGASPFSFCIDRLGIIL